MIPPHRTRQERASQQAIYPASKRPARFGDVSVSVPLTIGTGITLRKAVTLRVFASRPVFLWFISVGMVPVRDSTTMPIPRKAKKTVFFMLIR